MTTTYDTDVVAWAKEQARLLRAGKFDQLDVEHIADEVEDVGKSEQRELANRMAVLLAHLIKWQYQPTLRSASWEATIRVQRDLIAKRLQRTPSLGPMLTDDDWRGDIWADARLTTAKETGQPFDLYPQTIPWDMARQILQAEFFPDA